MVMIGELVAWVIAVGLLIIGGRFLLVPQRAAVAFGIPPGQVRRPDPFHAVKAVRDIGFALLLGLLAAAGSPALLGWGLILGAVVPVGDAVIVLRAGGTRAAALGIHGLTAAVAVVGGVLLLLAAR